MAFFTTNVRVESPIWSHSYTTTYLKKMVIEPSIPNKMPSADRRDNCDSSLYNSANRNGMFSKTLHLICTAMLWWQISGVAIAQSSASPVSAFQTSRAALIKIVRAEDGRRWDDALKQLLADPDPAVRKRAALAAGRIGNEGAVPVLTEMLLTDRDNEVRQMAAFALGEIESAGGAYALVEVFKRNGEENARVRARGVEALGKIVAAMISAPAVTDPATKAIDEDRLDILRATIVEALRFEDSRRSRPDRVTILLALTAVLRAKPDGVGKLVAEFLNYSDSSIVATALNTLARLRLKNGNDEALKLLAKHEDPIVRANAARVLGVTEDKAAFDVLLDRALHDSDLRVRVSAIRALGQLKDERAAQPLLQRAENLLVAYRGRKGANPPEKNELLDIVTTLGRALQNSNNAKAIDFVKRFRTLDQLQSPETEISFARIAPETYLPTEPLEGTAKRIDEVFSKARNSWRASNNIAQALAEFANLPKEKQALRMSAFGGVGLLVGDRECHERGFAPAVPANLRAFVALKDEMKNFPSSLGPGS